ncbi:MAG TPA: hypothetical protein PK668_07050 [Myxococcota bacterium]|nr:hypothetical protein [Myxococcota bacterium]HRY92398.1 hypothetical protein [Myxococcota bacterium]HSA22868.1 hypothetical protein [Myxococcota bacterium]
MVPRIALAVALLAAGCLDYAPLPPWKAVDGFDGADGEDGQDGGVESDGEDHTSYGEPCMRRGGYCHMVHDLDAPCPPGSYSPFRGFLHQCLMIGSSICCVDKGDFGSPCIDDADCDLGGCLREASGYPEGGLCTQVCDPGASPTGCPVYSVCIPVFFSQAVGMCMLTCGGYEGCREGWSCQAFPRQPWGADERTVNVCWAREIAMGMAALGEICSQDDDCLSMLCREDPSGQRRCASTCGGEDRCLYGFTCQQASGGGGLCFPG